MVTFKNLSIQWKLVSIIIFTVGFVLCFTNIGIYHYTSSQTMSSMEQRLKIFADIVGDRSTAALIFGDKKIAQENLQSLKASETIRSACLYSQDGQIFSSYYRAASRGFCKDKISLSIIDKEDSAFSYSNATNGDSLVTVTTKIILKGSIIGYIIIYSDLSGLENINSNILYNELLFSLLALFLAVLLVWYLKGSITEPINSLAKTAMDVSSSGDFSKRAKKVNSDETGYLTEQFNLMLEKIQRQDEGLKEHHKKLQELVNKLDHQASHDMLTGLYNRSGIEPLVEATLENKKDQQQSLLCYIDLDQFKIVNDTCGHTVGDEMLRRISFIMKDVFIRHGHVCRMGGDEFVVLLTDCDLQKGSAIIETFLDRLDQLDFKWSDRDFPISASVGIAKVVPGIGFTELLMQADSACYMAKESGSQRMQLYIESKVNIDQRHSDIIMYNYLLRSELDNKYRLFKQPIYYSDSLNEACFYEVLLRLIDKNNNILPPAEFIPLAEHFNLMPQIDRWVVKNVFEHITQSSDNNSYFINISGVSILDEGMGNYIKNLTNKLSIPTDRVCFEITETSSIGNMSAANRFISELSSIGFKFALDDFGSGYSTLDYLRSLPVDYVKLDGSLIENIHTDPISLEFAKAIDNISHLANKKTIAEHISNKELYDAVSVLGIDYCQGYWLGKPEILN